MTAPRHATRHRRARPQRGAALLVAMLILSVVATLATAMVWQQWRAVQVEAAERARTQSAWILNGALDWARLILREDGRDGGADHLGEPWAVPLAEARLSTFLAVDRDATTDDGPEAFLAGAITDAQARYNLRNLVVQGQVVPAQLRVLQRLCEAAGLPASVAEQIAAGLRAAWSDSADADAPLTPRHVAELRWLGVSDDAVQRLAPWLTLLPAPTPVNLNTAPREVLAAVLEGLDAASAERLVQARDRSPFRSVEQAKSVLGADSPVRFDGTGVTTAYFVVQGRLRLDDRIVEERSLVQRSGRDVVVLQRERVNMVEAPR
ncbi:type II secretion system minor pseudopilin GspK [Calidifontimicrobium sp. SYSU G02091]|uniref:type II secretion system minor pseudopilin GspK n=1 Tax=Calidifontimicrobium sp. SYSU G02091 TaxID=2926421 RepID=UPI001F53A6AE|nr:type II secretion system minor pseudopilin GspK [Calidifontimicrobium sp. SYSU G02091]MCI1190434.1 type II secretion system minor pseudopilin GspK [Calidifontimicrobium sp. SYSU G02091]